MTTVSVIIPSYNQQEFLADAIESVLNQTGSTDNSLEIARKFEDRGVRVINQVNKGLASARNTGIMNSTGDYILPLDSDDMLAEDAIELITEKIEETNADVVGPSLKTFGKFNEFVILMADPKLEDFKQGNRLGYGSAIKKSVLLECGGYSPRMTWGYEDLHLWYDLLLRGKTIVTMPEPLLLYRTRDNTMIHTAQQHHNELMAQIQHDFHIFDEN
jgi:glycosyltransferase involved in cell wall biosynthesis